MSKSDNWFSKLIGKSKIEVKDVNNQSTVEIHTGDVTQEHGVYTEGSIHSSNVAGRDIHITHVHNNSHELIGANRLDKNKSKYLNAVPFYDHNLFLNRIDVMGAIHDALNKSKEIIILNGIGGVGKSTFALAYCNNPKYTKDYDYIAWVSTTRGIKFDLMLSLSNEEINCKFRNDLSIDENFNQFIDKLRKIDGNNLLIIDNANNPEEILSIKTDIEKIRWKILITSRTHIPYIKSFSLVELEIEYGKELFYRYYTREKNDVMVVQLLQNVYFNTLIIELLAKVGNLNPSLNLNKLCDLVSEYFLKAPQLQIDVPIDIPTMSKEKFDKEIQIYSFIHMIFQTDSILNDEKIILRYFTVMPSIEIDIKTIFILFNMVDSTSKCNPSCHAG